MSIPGDLLYTTSHEWVRKESDGAVIGLTHYAQDQLGEVVYVELPEAGVAADTEEELGTIESVKAVSEFYAPLAGEVTEVNEKLADEPNLINDDPYGEGWLVKISTSEDGELLTAQQYEELLAKESQ